MSVEKTKFLKIVCKKNDFILIWMCNVHLINFIIPTSQPKKKTKIIRNNIETSLYHYIFRNFKIPVITKMRNNINVYTVRFNLQLQHRFFPFWFQNNSEKLSSKSSSSSSTTTPSSDRKVSDGSHTESQLDLEVWI